MSFIMSVFITVCLGFAGPRHLLGAQPPASLPQPCGKAYCYIFLLHSVHSTRNACLECFHHMVKREF